MPQSDPLQLVEELLQLREGPPQTGAGRGFIGTPAPSANSNDFPAAAPGTTNLFEDRGVNTGTMGWWMQPPAAPVVEPETTFSKGVRFEKQSDGTWKPILPPTSAAATKVVEPPEVKALRQEAGELDRKARAAESDYQVAHAQDPQLLEPKTQNLRLKARELERQRDERRAALIKFEVPTPMENPFAVDPFAMGAPAPVAKPKDPFTQGFEKIAGGSSTTSGASSKYRIWLKQ